MNPDRHRRRARPGAQPTHKRQALARPDMTSGARTSPHPCCPICSVAAFVLPMRLVRWNPAGDDLWECSACGYMTAYRVTTGQFEPPAGQPSEGWQPPLGWPRPRMTDPAVPSAAPDPMALIVEPATAASSLDQHDKTEPVGVELAPDARAATTLAPRYQETPEDPDNRQQSEGAGERIGQETDSLAPRDASTDRAADVR